MNKDVYHRYTINLTGEDCSISTGYISKQFDKISIRLCLEKDHTKMDVTLEQLKSISELFIELVRTVEENNKIQNNG